MVGVAAARDRLHRRRIEHAVFHETLVDIDADDLAEHDATIGRLVLVRLELDDAQELAFERAGRSGDPRRLDAIRTTVSGLKAITAANVQQAAQAYLRDDRAFKVVVLPNGYQSH